MPSLKNTLTLTIGIFVLAACNAPSASNNNLAKNSTFRLVNIINQSSEKFTLSVNDEVVINSHSKTDPWWIIYPGKNAHKHLKIKAHPNQRQYSLMFNQPGEYRITGTQKTASGEMANFTRSLTFVVN
jgi:hypothetical protein